MLYQLFYLLLIIFNKFSKIQFTFKLFEVTFLHRLYSNIVLNTPKYNRYNSINNTKMINVFTKPIMLTFDLYVNNNLQLIYLYNLKN